ncbi:MAG TPA: ASCH domain-containing protein [Ktedonobacteraceae bacterium]|nr:ASCH domain-containing protein [Ktedonobacteraceae bacterium]
MVEIKERQRGKVYPVGYGRHGALEYVDRLMMQPQMLLIDTRFRPKSWCIDWREGTLQKKYGKRYRRAGAYLGNVNFQGGPITLSNPTEGIRGLCMYLDEGYDLILLCQCPTYHTCHRKVVVDLLLQQVSVEVIQPELLGQEDEALLCLSVRQPYAYWLSHPESFIQAGIRPKTIENRDWATKYRGPLLIHASVTFEHDAIETWISRCPELEHAIPLDERAYTKGAIVGIAELVEVVHQSDDPWFIGPYGFVFANARPFEPVPYRGQLKLFPVPVSLIQAQLLSTV